ncbi:MAG: hypothetical protein Q8R24_05875 [Legionellaceae bacterium]|nr:hypothetical protein [Legionellaceae bacterium]
MPTSSGTTVGTSQAPLPTLPRSPRIANLLCFNYFFWIKSVMICDLF